MKYGGQCCALSYLNNESFSSVLCFSRAHVTLPFFPRRMVPLPVLLFGIWINKLHFDQRLKQNARNGKRNRNESWHFNRFQLLCIAFHGTRLSLASIIGHRRRYCCCWYVSSQNDNNNKTNNIQRIHCSWCNSMFEGRMEENKCKPKMPDCHLWCGRFDQNNTIWLFNLSLACFPLAHFLWLQASAFYRYDRVINHITFY